MAPMIEADRDHRLDAREQATLARHLAVCASCRSLARDLDRIRALASRPLVPPATQLEHQRGRVALLNQAAVGSNGAVRRPQPSHPARTLSSTAARAASHDGAASGPKPRVGRTHALALAAAAALVFSGRAVVQRSSGHAVAVAMRLPAPPRLAPIRRETTVESTAGTRFTRHHEGRAERVELDEGTLDLKVRPLGPGETFVVATGDAEVEVRGTIFHVEARDRHIERVSVSEGKVEVRWAGAMTLLHAGEAWTPRRDPPSDPSSNVDADPEGSPAAPPAPSSTPTARSARPAPGSRVAPVAHATHASAPPSAPKAAPSAAPSADGSKAFAEGMRLVERGDYGAGADKLDAYRRANPTDPRAEDAAYLTILALQRAGRRDDATAAARRYLQQYPNGYRRAEVQKIAR